MYGRGEQTVVSSSVNSDSRNAILLGFRVFSVAATPPIAMTGSGNCVLDAEQLNSHAIDYLHSN
jgi:hypothetical protein